MLDDDEQSADECERGICLEGDRWDCASVCDWQDSSGMAPWGDDCRESKLRWLATMSPEEAGWLAATAEGDLDSGWWQGVKTPNGGWEDGQPWDEGEAQWRAVARDYLELRRCDPEAPLTEGLIDGALQDLCQELAWHRKWCPRLVGIARVSRRSG